MSPTLGIRRFLVLVGILAVAVVGVVAARTYLTFQPAAITLGPETTVYLRHDPPLRLRVHEAIHRRQMRDKSPLGRVWSALRYNFDYGYRLEEEAEAKAGELCLRIHRFSADLADYTTARSRFQARAYRAWAWERMGMVVPDRVGARLREGEACHEILRDVRLDLPPGTALDDDETVELAAFHFLQAYGSSEHEVLTWRARLELAAFAEPAAWSLPEELPPFGLVGVAREVTAVPDSTVDPAEAGRALHRLTYSMADRMYVQLRPPIPGYRGRPVVEEGRARERTGVPLDRWPDRLLPRALAGELDEGAVAWLDTVAAHPLHLDFETFARAPEADIVGTRYRLPFPEEWERLVLSELDPVRTAFRVQWGRAALAVARGDTARAGDILRVVVAGALQWIHHSPFEVDVLEGLVLLDEALGGLRVLEEAAGESGEWVQRYETLEPRAWVVAERAALFAQDPQIVHRAMPALAADPGVPHAFKRFAYRQVMLADVCLEMREEPDVREAHDRWRVAVEEGLVRRTSDRQVLELMRRKVRDLIRRAEVPPARMCRSGSGLRPGARMAIILAPPEPVPTDRAAIDDE